MEYEELEKKVFDLQQNILSIGMMINARDALMHRLATANEELAKLLTRVDEKTNELRREMCDLRTSVSAITAKMEDKKPGPSGP